MDVPKRFIAVLAGVNGAGKSSVIGQFVRNAGQAFFNPDEAARDIVETKSRPIDEANALAWEQNRRNLEETIRTGTRYAFETTLGGKTLPAMLREAAEAGFEVLVFFVGLSSPEQHIARVRARVAAGGHDIPEEKIHERWDASRRNIILLMPFLTELRVFDNSVEGDPASGTIPEPRLLLHRTRGEGVIAPAVEDLLETPEWAKPIVAQALKLSRR